MTRTEKQECLRRETLHLEQLIEEQEFKPIIDAQRYIVRLIQDDLARLRKGAKTLTTETYRCESCGGEYRDERLLTHDCKTEAQR